MTTAEAVTPPETTAETEASRQIKASLANTYRLTSVAERLAMQLQSGGISNLEEFRQLCLSLARGIDFAVANGEVPTRAEDFPPLLKKICDYKQESFLQAAVMALMISVKSACNVGWFQEQSSQELCALANEIGSSYCSPRDINAGQSDPHPVITIVMSKYYPLMKMGETLASLVVKPGYGVFVVDFLITKAVKHSKDEKIRLFVIQTDNTESSACLISPPQVSFLINGKGVDRRTNVFMDLGPLVPTTVTPILKYGTNLLQAVGQFNAHYYIAVAFVKVMPLPENPILMDYVHPDSTVLDPDSDIIEGPFRISLNCPISYKRIKTPVKGHSCKHLQCFDFSNYVDINSRRPSWRCPHCNQHVCYTDIRVDQNMVKVLSEVGDNVSEVIITADGSWKAVLDSDDSMETVSDKSLNCPKQGSDPQDSMHVDLTADDDTMDVVGTGEIEDIKPVEAILQNHPVAITATQTSQLSNAINQIAFQMGVGSWPSAHVAHQSVASNAWSAGQVVSGNYANLMPSTVIPNSSAPPQNSTMGGLSNSNLSPVIQSQVSAAGNSQLQQSQFVNSVSNNEYGRIRQIPAHINRNPIAVQALPVPAQTLSPQQRPRASVTMSPVTPQTTPTMASAGNTVGVVSRDMNRQQPFPGSHINQLQNQNFPGQSVQQTGGIRTPSPVPGAYRPSSLEAPQMPLPRSQSPTLGQSSPLSQTPAQSGRPLVGGSTSSGVPQYARYSLSAQRATQMARQAPFVPVQNQASRIATQPSVAAGGTRTPTTEQIRNIGVTSEAAGISSASSPSEQDWRPAGRMRGSLSGRNYEAYKDLLIQPTQTSQPSRPSQSTQPSQPPGNFDAYKDLGIQPSQPSQPPRISNLTSPPTLIQPTQTSQPSRPSQSTQPSQPPRNFDAYKDLGIQPSQPSQPPRISNLTSPPTRAPQGNLTSHPTSVPPHLQSRNRIVNASQSQNNPTT